MKRPYSRAEAPEWCHVPPRALPRNSRQLPRHSRGSRTDPRGKSTPGKRLPGLGKIPANFSRLSAHHVTAAERERHFPRGRGRFLRGRKHHICLG